VSSSTHQTLSWILLALGALCVPIDNVAGTTWIILGLAFLIDARFDELLAAHKQTCIFMKNREQEEEEDRAERS